MTFTVSEHHKNDVSVAEDSSFDEKEFMSNVIKLVI